MRSRDHLTLFVARIPTSLHVKLLVAFLTMVVLLIAVAVVGLQELRRANRRGEDLVQLEWKITALRQLQVSVMKQRSIIFAAFLVFGLPDQPRSLVYPEAMAWEYVYLQPSQSARQAAVAMIRRGLEGLRYDFDRVQSLDRSGVCTNMFAITYNRLVFLKEGGQIPRLEEAYARYTNAVANVANLMDAGKLNEARNFYGTVAGLWANQLDTLITKYGCYDENAISVSGAEATMLKTLATSHDAYTTSLRRFIGFSLGTLSLALFLGYVISWSVIGPVRRMDTRFKQIASGDFTQRVDVPNRDELGALAADLNRMNEELKALYQRLEAESQHKSQFLANMSHELRTPLNAIIGYTELLLDHTYGEVSKRVREVLERVQHSGRHLLGLINDVLDLSKIEAGQLTLSLDEYSMRHVMQTVVAAVEPLASEKRLALEVSMPSELPTSKGDERRVTQVLLNLVGNAIKFTDVGRVKVQVAASDGEFLLSVTDTGPGIPDDEQERIFEEFYQGENSDSRKKGGTGLGLSIAKKIIELHGGRMWLESTVGKGSTFWFTLPVWVERQVERREQTNPRG